MAAVWNRETSPGICREMRHHWLLLYLRITTHTHRHTHIHRIFSLHHLLLVNLFASFCAAAWLFRQLSPSIGSKTHSESVCSSLPVLFFFFFFWSIKNSTHFLRNICQISIWTNEHGAHKSQDIYFIGRRAFSRRHSEVRGRKSGILWAIRFCLANELIQPVATLTAFFSVVSTCKRGSFCFLLLLFFGVFLLKVSPLWCHSFSTTDSSWWLQKGVWTKVNVENARNTSRLLLFFFSHAAFFPLTTRFTHQLLFVFAPCV